jgi:hypothetical protein
MLCFQKKITVVLLCFFHRKSMLCFQNKIPNCFSFSLSNSWLGLAAFWPPNVEKTHRPEVDSSKCNFRSIRRQFMFRWKVIPTFGVSSKLYWWVSFYRDCHLLLEKQIIKSYLHIFIYISLFLSIFLYQRSQRPKIVDAWNEWRHRWG